MRPLPTRFLIAILAVPFCAYANDDSCKNIPELQQHAPGECVCGKGLSKLPLTAPDGMSLIAACGYKKEEFVGTVGEFYFKGKATLKGEVRRVNSSASRESVLFDAKVSGKYSEFRNAVLSLKLEDEPGVIEQFKLPPPTAESPCWAADAVIRVRMLYVLSGYGLDDEGSYPKQYDVLKVGQQRQCREAAAAEEEAAE